ncbi:ZIP zinc/iron transport family [Gigaspora margarita]|uniref:ZIP zinc/iron transport family n=1 Tax=Gigaspora margarita TaxID=4874 RepID=A0A8H4AFP8_GIGMA|nr:ZIP zinc/iron transport family [Gigaspora margarita]
MMYIKIGAFIPVISKKYPKFTVPNIVFFVAKHFGSGVILATAFVHMLPSAFTSLNNPCLQPVWTSYSAWPGAIAMMAALFIFITEFVALKIAAKVERADENNHETTNDITNETNNKTANHTNNAADESLNKSEARFEYLNHHSETALSSRAQIIGITILECGICFHSVIIGMALSVAGDEFVSLFVALIFHQMFEGLGLGSRIAELKFPPNSIKPWLMSLAYGTTTPIGIFIGLLIRNSYNPNSDTALIVQGVFDSISAGILLFAALVELIANDFIYDLDFQKIPKANQIGAFVCLLVGAGIMSAIGT